MKWFWRGLSGAGALAGVAGLGLMFYASEGTESLFFAVPIAGLVWAAVQTLRHEDALFPKIVLSLLSLWLFGSLAAAIYLLRHPPY